MYVRMCEICGESPAKINCSICGRDVCEKHFDFFGKRCLICKESTCEVCNNNLSVTRCGLCGRKTCHYCSIEMDEVRRICMYCVVSLRFKRVEKLARSIIYNH